MKKKMLQINTDIKACKGGENILKKNEIEEGPNIFYKDQADGFTVLIYSLRK